METAGRPFAATWRDELGDVVATTCGDTICIAPRKPWRIRFHRDGFEGVIRCGECPGCRELDRRRLGEQFYHKYGARDVQAGARKGLQSGVVARAEITAPARLYVVRIYAPLDQHARIAHNLHRRRRLAIEPGFVRLGVGSFAVLSAARNLIAAALRAAGLEHRIERLLLQRGRRAFRVLTAGLLVSRAAYGEQVNRWYVRGLPKLDRQKWEVKKLGTYRSYDRISSPRAWNGSGLVLVPPEVWRVRRVDRRALRRQLARQSSPEGVRKVMGLVADAIRAAGRAFGVGAAPKALLDREVVVAWYRQQAERVAARTNLTAPDSLIAPFSWKGRYGSSEHEQGELLPGELAKMRRRENDDARKQRAIRESMAIIERMRARAARDG